MYFTLYEMDKMVNHVSKNLVVTPVSRQSSVINLKIRDEIPQRGEAILTAIVDAYNQAAIERKNGIAMKTLEFIESRLKNVGAQLDSVEGGIQKYRDRAGIVDISEQSRLYLQSIEDNDREINMLNMRASALDEVEKYVESKNKEGVLAPSTINIADPTLSTLVTKLSETQSQYESLAKTTGENSPILQSLKEEMDRIKPSILDNIRNQKKSISSSRSYLDQINNRYSSMLSTVPKKERELVEVSRQQNIKNDIYKFLLQKREETAYSISSALPDCFMVNQPTSSIFPVSPKKPLLALMAGILPLILGTFVVTIKESLNGKILYRKDIEQATAFPVIGELMYEKLSNPIVTMNAERSFIQEQFRQIRGSLKHQGNPKGNFKRILVTSSVKGEGKSFVSSNLAISLARSGKKVALLEMDLHQPKLREMLEIEPCAGITDYLMGEVEADQIRMQTTIHPNLHLIPSGTMVDEPSELLVNGRLEQLLNYLDTKYDVLMIDTAPLLALSDASVIAPNVNLILYIVRHNHTPKGHIEMLDENMRSYQLENVAIVFNGVKTRGFSKKGYGYGYGYGNDAKSNYDGYMKKKKVA
jgi:capsular exopolysaccharide synthesis family protein